MFRMQSLCASFGLPFDDFTLHQRTRLTSLTVGYLSAFCIQGIPCLMQQSLGNRFLSSLRYSVAQPVKHFNNNNNRAGASDKLYLQKSMH